MQTGYVKTDNSIPTAAFLMILSATSLLNSGTVELDREPTLILDDDTAKYYMNATQTTYTNVPVTRYTFDQVKTLHAFASNLLDNIEDLDPDFSRAIDDEFWNLI